MRAGVIRAAINLELGSKASSINTVGILAAGINGQLPNLDLINSAVESFRQHYVPVVLDRCQQRNAQCDDVVSRFIDGFRALLKFVLPSKYTDAFARYLGDLNGMLRFIKTLVVGPSGSHANFIRYNIDSVTLSLMDGKNARASSKVTLHSILQSIELIVKSLSSIEEKLHQVKKHEWVTSYFVHDK
jgi:glycosylphosphatidylinositol transamidase